MSLRLLKIVMQPVFVIDDGESLTERVAESFTITAADLDGFAEKFRADMAQLAESLEADQ